MRRVEKKKDECDNVTLANEARLWSLKLCIPKKLQTSDIRELSIES